MARRPKTAVEIHTQNLRRQADALLQLSDAGGTRVQRALLADLRAADRILAERIRLTRTSGGNVRFGEAQARMMRHNVRMVTDLVEGRVALRVAEGQAHGARMGARLTADQIAVFDREFQVIRPIQIRSALTMQRAIEGTQGALITRRESSIRRYGLQVTDRIEREIRRQILAGSTQDQMVEALFSKFSFFPSRYFAERIVRTELAYAANATSMETIRASGVSRKKILAHIDKRTAEDSLVVHGQVRELDGLFRDGAGREYLHPPARPNDREWVIAWDRYWRNTDDTRALTREERNEILSRNESYQRGLARGRRAKIREQNERSAQNPIRTAEKAW